MSDQKLLSSPNIHLCGNRKLLKTFQSNIRYKIGSDCCPKYSEIPHIVRMKQNDS